MITLRNADSRGKTQIDWLNSRHTFSFGGYQDMQHMGFRSLRVINDDRVMPGGGFGMHGHKDMEIISIVLEGALEHKDSLGHGEILKPGEVQVMTAGKGIRHSEFNPSHTEPVHFLQVWIMPETQNILPAYGQRSFPLSLRHDQLRRVAGRIHDEQDGALKIHQDANLYLGAISVGNSLMHTIAEGRAAWVHVTKGELLIGPHALHEGDGAAIEFETQLTLAGGKEAAEFLLFDLA